MKVALMLFGELVDVGFSSLAAGQNKDRIYAQIAPK